jgi:hypothetical protein
MRCTIAILKQNRNLYKQLNKKFSSICESFLVYFFSFTSFDVSFFLFVGLEKATFVAVVYAYFILHLL